MNDFRFTELVTKAIRDINSEPSLTPEERAAAIKKLGGIPKQILYDYLNVTYRSGPDLVKSIADMIDPRRPKGGPQTTEKGTTLKTITDKLKRINTPKSS